MAASSSGAAITGLAAAPAPASRGLLLVPVRAAPGNGDAETTNTKIADTKTAEALFASL